MYNYDQVLNNTNMNNYATNTQQELEKVKAELAQLKNETKMQAPAPQLQTATILEYKNSDRYHILIGKYIKPLLDLPMIPQMLTQFGFGQQYGALLADVQKDYITYEKEVEQKNKIINGAENSEIQELKAQVAALTAKLNTKPQQAPQTQQGVQNSIQQGMQQFPQMAHQVINNGGINNNG